MTWKAQNLKKISHTYSYSIIHTAYNIRCGSEINLLDSQKTQKLNKIQIKSV